MYRFIRQKQLKRTQMVCLRGCEQQRSVTGNVILVLQVGMDVGIPRAMGLKRRPSAAASVSLGTGEDRRSQTRCVKGCAMLGAMATAKTSLQIVLALVSPADTLGWVKRVVSCADVDGTARMQAPKHVTSAQLDTSARMYTQGRRRVLCARTFPPSKVTEQWRGRQVQR
jgi:hypothetical protein